MISNMSTLIAHYTKLETAAHYILPKEALRISMGAFLSFNDPKETKGWHFKTSEKMTINQHQLFHERRISSEIKKHFGALSFSNGMEESTDQFNFNRCDYKPRMWAQYGDNSKGLCLVFNKEKLFELAKQQFDNIAMVFADDVQYFNITGLPDFTDNEVTLPKEYILNESHDKIVQMILKSEHRKPYFFLKHSDWKEENEYRIVVYMQQQPEDLYLYFSGALVGITLGCDCTQTSLVDNTINDDELSRKLNAYNYVLNYCRSHDVKYSRVIWTNGCPSTDPIEPCPI